MAALLALAPLVLPRALAKDQPAPPKIEISRKERRRRLLIIVSANLGLLVVIGGIGMGAAILTGSAAVTFTVAIFGAATLLVVFLVVFRDEIRGKRPPRWLSA